MAVATHMLARVAVSGRSCRWLAFNCTVVPFSARGAEVRHSWSSAVAAVSGAPWHPLSSPRSTRRQRSVVLRSSDRESDLVDSLKDDLVRLQNKQQAKAQQLGNDSPQGKVEPDEGPLSSLKQTVDKVLIADFFFVLAALVWLAAGVGEKSTFNSTKLLDAWYPLWMLVFQPAIGVLMLGALVSGAAGWLKNKSSA